MKYKLLELRPWMVEEDTGVYEMLQEIPKHDIFDQTNEFAEKTKEQVLCMIADRTRQAYSLYDFQSNQMTEPEDKTSMEVYVLFVDDYPVCFGGFRFFMNDYLRKHCGNIWYKTRPSERNKGYATILTQKLIDFAKFLGYKELISQCDVENIPSNKVLTKCGFKTYKNPLCLDWDDTNFYKKTL